MAKLSIKQYAAKHNVTVQTVYTWIDKGLKFTRPNGLILINENEPVPLKVAKQRKVVLRTALDTINNMTGKLSSEQLKEVNRVITKHI